MLAGLITGQIWMLLTGLGALAAGGYALARRPAADFALALAGACLAHLRRASPTPPCFSRSVVPVPWPAAPPGCWSLVLIAGAGATAAGVLRLHAARAIRRPDRNGSPRPPAPRPA